MMTLKELLATFPTDDACREFLMERRWPNGVRCPRCQKTETVYKITQPWKWECSNKDCRKGHAYRFSIISGTVFENTKYPLRTWFEVVWQMLNSKKGVSAMQIQRQIGAKSYQTAWYMCHRLRAAMHDPDFKKLMGIVEVDETYIGGKNANRPLRTRFDLKGRGAVGKTAVIGAIARKGNVICRMVEDATATTANKFVREMVSSRVSLIATDTGAAYQRLDLIDMPHKMVDHKALEYVRGEVHTNNIESFWSLLKRGVIGTYHNVSKKYLPLYLAEFQFRHNNRKNPDIFGEAIAGC